MGKTKKSLKKYDKQAKDLMHDLEIANDLKRKEEELSKIDPESLYTLNTKFDPKKREKLKEDRFKWENFPQSETEKALVDKLIKQKNKSEPQNPKTPKPEVYDIWATPTVPLSQN